MWLCFTEHNFAFAFEVAAGKYEDVYSSWNQGQLFPLPEIEGYYRFGYKRFDGFIALNKKYQYITRDEYLEKAYFMDSRFIYALRTGISFLLLPQFVVGVCGDINYAVRRLDNEYPSEVNEGYAPEFHIKYEGHSNSYGIGLTILSHRKKPMLAIGYDSKVNVPLNDFSGSFRYLIPEQIAVSLNFSMSNIEICLGYYYRFSKYQQDRLRTIKANDFMIDFLLPISEMSKFYMSCYTLPLSYSTSAKGFGVGVGPRLLKAKFFNEFLMFYETGSTQDWETKRYWRLNRFGIQLVFAV